MELMRAYELDMVAIQRRFRLNFCFRVFGYYSFDTKSQYSTQLDWIPTLFQFTNYPKYQKNSSYIMYIAVNWEMNQKKIISRIGMS